MGKKKTPPPAAWTAFLRGTLLALGLYLAGILLLALLIVKGTTPEQAAFPGTAVLCVLSAACGGVAAARRSSWGTLPASMLAAALFAASLAVLGFLCWQNVAWSSHGAALLLCALAGGVLGALPGGRKRRKKSPLVKIHKSL